MLFAATGKNGKVFKITPEGKGSVYFDCPAANVLSLAFTPETWAHARHALRLRKRGEIFLGWMHSHPVKEWCKKCPPEKRKKCPLMSDFFSIQDRHLHRTAFPGAHSIALVINQLAADHQTISLFGWSRGLLVQRGFRSLEDVVHQPETAG